ncbi:MAG: hypothetical protein K0V04_34630, partial [Deltaproteobacteria bacterium]|nr:hypothetical protein [Deltaproteobacteria bacterium]
MRARYASLMVGWGLLAAACPGDGGSGHGGTDGGSTGDNTTQGSDDAPGLDDGSETTDVCPDACCDPADADGDGVPDCDDVCPDQADPAQADADADGVGDACDLCPSAADP